jgi:hypothetical protein
MNYNEDAQRGTCVSYESIDTSGFPGVTSNPTKRFYERSHEVADAMNVSASLSYSALLYSGSGRASYANSQRTSSYAVNMFVADRVERDDLIVVGARLTDEAAALAQRDLMAFYNRCGHGYAAAMVPGGEFIATISITSENAEQREHAAASLRASGFGASAGFDWDQSTVTLSNAQDIKMTMYQNGGPNDAVPDSVEQLNQFYRDFRTQVSSDNQRPFIVVYLDYATLANWPGNELPLHSAIPYRLGKWRWDYQDLIIDINDIRSRPERYMNPDLEELRSLRDQLASALLEMDDVAEICITDPESESCEIRESWVDPVTIELPHRWRNPDCPRYSRDGLIVAAPDAFPLPHVRGAGDTEMAGNKPVTTIGAVIDYDTYGRGNLIMDVTMKEGKRDWTTFSKRYNKNLDDLFSKKGCILKQVSPIRGSLRWTAPSDYHKWKRNINGDRTPGNDLVASADCKSDTKGRETGRIGCVNIRLKPLSVVYDHEENVYGTSGDALIVNTRSRRIMDETGTNRLRVSTTGTSDPSIRRSMIISKQMAWETLSAAEKSRHVMPNATESVHRHLGQRPPSLGVLGPARDPR